MLPGFRFLFATVVLSFSVLIFGLGAAALLRSAHEEFVGIPAWRAAQQSLMPASDTNRPTLALLRVEPAPAPIANAESQNHVSPNSPPNSESIAQDRRPSDESKTASLDTQATEEAVVAEKPSAAAKAVAEKTATEEIKKPDEISKPKVRRTKRARAGKTIRHWTARGRQPVQPQQSQQLFGGGASSAFPGFEAPDASASGGTAGNRRASARSPF